MNNFGNKLFGMEYILQGDYMFLVFSKEKITTYLVSILTVALLFCMVTNFQAHKADSIETSADTGKMLPIYKVKTDEKKVALTMNCAWNADDIDKILEVLKNNDVKITFFMVGNWIDKYPDAVKKINDAGQEIRKS